MFGATIFHGNRKRFTVTYARISIVILNVVVSIHIIIAIIIIVHEIIIDVKIISRTVIVFTYVNVVIATIMVFYLRSGSFI